MDWLFHDEDYSDNDNSDNDDDAKESNGGNKDNLKTEPSTGWGDTFSVDVDSWKYESCMAQNKTVAKVCATCKTSRSENEKKSFRVVRNKAIDSKLLCSSDNSGIFNFSETGTASLMKLKFSLDRKKNQIISLLKPQ